MAKWYPIYLDLTEYDELAFQGAYNPYGSSSWYTVHRHSPEAVWQKVCEHENVHTGDRIKITTRENVDWAELLSSAPKKGPKLPFKRVFILKCKDKQDFLHLKLALSRFVIDPEGFACKPGWLKNV